MIDCTREDLWRRVSIVYFCVLLLLSFGMYAQVNSASQVLNSLPEILHVRTYSSYNTSLDNVPQDYLYMCMGESTRTIPLRMLTMDNNSYTEITGGNISYLLVSVLNGSMSTVSSFGNASKVPPLESILGPSQVSYLDNLSLSSPGDYRILVNVTEVYGGIVPGEHNFTLNSTNCIRMQQNATLVENSTLTLQGNTSDFPLVQDDSIVGSIVITQYSTSPVDNGSTLALDQYVTVDVIGASSGITFNVSVVVGYNESHVSTKSLTESSLQMYLWNDTTWGVTPDTLNTGGNTLTFFAAGVTNGSATVRLGTFSIRGTTQPAQQSEEEEDGGGGTSDEPPGLPYYYSSEDVIEAPADEPAAQEVQPVTEQADDPNNQQPHSDDPNLFQPPDVGSRFGDNLRTFSSSGSRIDGSSGTNSSLDQIALSFLLGGTMDYCLIIIILFYLLWLITLYFWHKERKRRIELEKTLKMKFGNVSLEESMEALNDLLRQVRKQGGAGKQVKKKKK